MWGEASLTSPAPFQEGTPQVTARQAREVRGQETGPAAVWRGLMEMGACVWQEPTWTWRRDEDSIVVRLRPVTIAVAVGSSCGTRSKRPTPFTAPHVYPITASQKYV